MLGKSFKSGLLSVGVTALYPSMDVDATIKFVVAAVESNMKQLQLERQAPLAGVPLRIE